MTESNEGPSPPPKAIGQYKILSLLGEGGMGEVWLAKQTEPVHRRVALKIIKLGMDTKQVLARLEAERQALAVMDHPNIASFFDGGATETGRPYFVMELVQGIPITEYCDTHRLNTDERLELFIDVCNAVQHAHQKGVIHRDLKPSNILVAVKESEPVVKIIDFGIAKALGHDLTERTLVTRVGQIVGTPDYMSPEQAEQSGLDVDTRTDVYALGVILYELLVGVLPFDFAAKADQVIRHAIRETEVSRPSTKLTSLGDTQDTIARYRRTTADALRRELRTDLDWIILRAMEKDRTRRYATANGLVLELERHLRNEPVQAHAPSSAYRAKKFVRRHRVGVAFAGVVAILLSLFAVGMSIQAVRISRERDRAEQEGAKAQAVNDFLRRMLASANPWVEGRDVKVVDVLDQAAGEIDAVLGDQPGVESSVRTTLGRTYRELGLHGEADTQFGRALEAHQPLDPAGDWELATILNEIGVLRQLQGAFGVADSLFTEALEIREETQGRGHLFTAESLNNLCTVKTARGDFLAADSLCREALATRRGILGDQHLDVAVTESNLANLLFQKGDLEEAATLFESALFTQQGAIGSDFSVAMMMNNLAITYRHLERFSEAEPLYRESLEIKRRELGETHPQVAVAQNNLGVFLWQRGDLSEAEGLIREALASNRATYKDVNPEVSSNIQNLALILRDQGRLDEAEGFFRQTLAIDRQVLGDTHPDIARDFNNLGGLFMVAGRYSEAEAAFRESERIQMGNFPNDSWQVATARTLLGSCLIEQNRYEEAEPLVVRSYEIIQAEFGDAHGRTRAALGRVVRLYELLGRSQEAQEHRSRLPGGGS
jgi:non-specific serine/threonine protein kinase/serine/threonine-protein kinase